MGQPVPDGLHELPFHSLWEYYTYLCQQAFPGGEWDPSVAPMQSNLPPDAPPFIPSGADAPPYDARFDAYFNWGEGINATVIAHRDTTAPGSGPFGLWRHGDGVRAGDPTGYFEILQDPNGQPVCVQDGHSGALTSRGEGGKWTATLSRQDPGEAALLHPYMGPPLPPPQPSRSPDPQLEEAQCPVPQQDGGGGAAAGDAPGVWGPPAAAGGDPSAPFPTML
eukprot:gene50249-56824_t